ncbi:alpha/beta hydrolase [Aquihabitans daechungensis]|uniref:alpha/beta hydrolase n=1 Tax=Aquihabitans daechungensis TaxID=1052257 RepID=UPI003BA3DE39
MRHKMHLASVVIGAAIVVASLTACEPTYAVKVADVKLAIPCNGTTSVDAKWAVPEGVAPTGFVWLQHGFARSNAALADLQKAYSARGWIVVSPTISAFGTCSINAAALHAGVASLLAGSTSPGAALETSYDAARTKLGLPAADLPSSYALSGHSAGGALVTVVGGTIAANPSAAVANRLKGIVLLDPVENGDNGMAANLPKLAAKKVLTISGADSSCNSNSSGTKVLLPKRSGFAGVRLPSGCHCDAEAETTDGTCTLVCGTPKAANKSALKQLAADWISDLLRSTTTASAYPGGAYYEQTKAAGTITTLTGTA